MSKKIENAIRKLALSLPETKEEFPWGHSAFKVKSKSFIFMVAEPKKIKLSLKLPESGQDALTLHMTEPTAYGLGKSGWVTFYLEAQNSPPIAAIESWVLESYVAMAPKKLGDSIDIALGGKGLSSKDQAKAKAKKKVKKKVKKDSQQSLRFPKTS